MKAHLKIIEEDISSFSLLTNGIRTPDNICFYFLMSEKWKTREMKEKHVVFRQI